MQNWVFLCSLDNLLQKKRNCFLFFEIKFQNGAHLKKMPFLTYFSHFLVTREKLQKFLQHISHSHTYMYLAHPIDFFALPILKKNTNLSSMVSLWYGSWCWFLFEPFLEQNGEQNLSWNVYYWYVFTLMPNLWLFVNLGLWMTDVKNESFKFVLLSNL